MPESWQAFSWYAGPQRGAVQEAAMLGIVTAKGGDFWRETRDGLTHDDGCAFPRDAPRKFTADVQVVSEDNEPSHQAGSRLWGDKRHWCKVDVEYVGILAGNLPSFCGCEWSGPDYRPLRELGAS